MRRKHKWKVSFLPIVNFRGPLTCAIRVRNQITVVRETKFFDLVRKSGLKFVQSFFGDGVCRGMVRGASRFVILFHVVHFVTLSQRCTWVKLLLRYWRFLNLSIKISYLHKTVYSMASKSVPKGVKENLSSQSLHPFHATTFVISHLGPHKNRDTLSRVHRYWSFTPR